MTFRKPLVAGIAVAALMLSPLSAFAQDATTETPAAEASEAAPAEGSATEEVAAAVDNLASQNWLKVCDPLPDGQKACLMRQERVDSRRGGFAELRPGEREPPVRTGGGL